MFANYNTQWRQLRRLFEAMPKPGSNLPEFRSVQLDFAAHIRNPQVYPSPPDIEPRRMKIYTELFYNNIKSFMDSAFPISRQIVGEVAWRNLIREFVHQHPSQSPYFLQISEEFLTFLHTRGLDSLPGFLLELCHYEWVELSLDVAYEEADPKSYDPQGGLWGHLIVSRLMRPLVYEYPVHELGVKNQLAKPPVAPTYLLVYRNSDLKVRFVASNPVTHRLLDLLAELSARDAFAQIQQELAASGRTVSVAQMEAQGIQTLTKLRDAGIILGAAVADS